MSKSKDELVLKRSSLMMLLNSYVDDLNISMLSKVISVSRKSVYNTINWLILGGEGSNLLKLTTRCKPVTPITSEIKDIITIFGTNKSRVSPIRRICAGTVLEGINTRSIPFIFFMYLKYLHLSKIPIYLSLVP